MEGKVTLEVEEQGRRTDGRTGREWGRERTTFAAHTVDLTFVPLGGRASEVLMSLEAGVELLTLSSISFGAQIDRGPRAARVHMTCRGSSTYPCICLEPRLSNDSLTGNHDQDSQQTDGA
jgi:hypothetical protein